MQTEKLLENGKSYINEYFTDKEEHAMIGNWFQT